MVVFQSKYMNKDPPSCAKLDSNFWCLNKQPFKFQSPPIGWVLARCVLKFNIFNIF